jgi:hypothetical protein
MAIPGRTATSRPACAAWKSCTRTWCIPTSWRLETDALTCSGTGTRGHRYTSDTARRLDRDELLAMIEEEAVPV